MDYFRIYKEAVFNTRPGTPTFRDVPVLSEEVAYAPGFEYMREISDRRVTTTRVLGPKKVAGPVNMLARYDAIGELLLALFGKVITINPAAGVYSHAYTHEDSSTATLPSYGFDIGVESLRERRVSGAWVDKLTLSLSGAKELALTCAITGADEAGAAFASFTPSYSTLTPITGADVLSYQINAAEVTPEETQIVINNNSPAAHAHKARTLPRVEFGELEVTGTCSLKFTSATHLNDFLAETERDLYVKFRGPLISGTYYYELEIDINRISYDAGDAHINRQERKVQNLKWTALKPTSGDFIKATLQNAVASY